jgi:peroxiredoxin
MKTYWIILLAITAWEGMLASSYGQDPGASGQPEVGQRAIDFELPIVNGEGYLSLSETCKEGPTVLIFLRGYPVSQCAFDSTQVNGLVSRSKVLDQSAHRVVLVYPGQAKGLERNAERFMASRRMPEPLVIVRDDDMKVVNQWGLRWDNPRETAYPATFVLDRYGRIAWKKVSRSHAERSSVEEILKELRKL